MLGAQMQGGNQSGWSQTTRNVPQWLYPTNDQLVQTISQMMLGGNNPAIKQIQTSSADAINRNYAQMPRTVASKLSGLGFGKSGKLGTALYNTEASRLGDLSNLFSSTANMGLNEQNTGASLAEQLLNLNEGSTTTGAGTNLSVGSKLVV